MLNIEKPKVPITFKVHAELKKMIKDMAKEYNSTSSTIILAIIEEYFKNKQGGNVTWK